MGRHARYYSYTSQNIQRNDSLDECDKFNINNFIIDFDRLYMNQNYSIAVAEPSWDVEQNRYNSSCQKPCSHPSI